MKTAICILTLLGLVPTWTACPPIRKVSHSDPIIVDIESHLPSGHPYRDSDRITWVHEGTHGINSLLRQRYGCPAFYVLSNHAVLVQEPMTTLMWSTVANQVPMSLRGEVYGLYLRQMQSYWEHQPTYVFDEFVAYTNGAEARKQLGIQNRAETVRYAVEFIVYATCVPQASKSTDPQMRAFLMWQIERVVRLSGDTPYLARLRTASDAQTLRQFMRDYYGPTWTRKVFGF